MIQRGLKLPKSNSFFIFGPRGVGKSTLIHQQFAPSEAVTIDLLDDELLDQLLLDFSRFAAIIDSPENSAKSVFVDEVQKFPKILNVAHRQIYESKRQFILSGSSSRKLMQKGSNLLAGRAWVYRLYPFSALELQGDFDLKRALERGGLPDAYLAEPSAAREYLTAYVATYLQKEIQQEQWVRKLEPFRKFLAIAAQMTARSSTNRRSPKRRASTIRPWLTTTRSSKRPCSDFHCRPTENRCGRLSANCRSSI